MSGYESGKGAGRNSAEREIETGPGKKRSRSREQRNGTGKGQDDSMEGRSFEGGKGSGGAQQWKGNTKGSREGKGPIDKTIEGRLVVQGRIIQRLAQAKREEARFQNFVVELEGTCKQKLAQSSQDSNKSRPQVGKHPQGEIYEVNWAQFAKFHTSRLGEETITIEQKEAFRLFESFVKKIKRDNILDNGRNTLLRYFHPLGKRTKVPTGTWLWILVLDNTVSQGRDTHEWVLEHLGALRQVGIKIREDRAPLDNLERMLAEQLKI